jgi:mRNA interferase YafQ
MLRASATTQFMRDRKRMVRRGKDIEKLIALMGSLMREEPLPARLQDHKLSGEYSGMRECHLDPIGW